MGELVTLFFKIILPLFSIIFTFFFFVEYSRKKTKSVSRNYFSMFLLLSFFAFILMMIRSNTSEYIIAVLTSRLIPPLLGVGVVLFFLTPLSLIYSLSFKKHKKLITLFILFYSLIYFSSFYLSLIDVQEGPVDWVLKPVAAFNIFHMLNTFVLTIMTPILFLRVAFKVKKNKFIYHKSLLFSLIVIVGVIMNILLIKIPFRSQYPLTVSMIPTITLYILLYSTIKIEGLPK